jgi:transposase-like protein
MTKPTMDLSELLAKHDQGDFLRGIAEAVLQLIMESDVDGLIGAGRHERSGERTTWRNGYRERALDTRLGTLNLRVPKLRQGSCQRRRKIRPLRRSKTRPVGEDAVRVVERWGRAECSWLQLRSAQIRMPH